MVRTGYILFLLAALVSCGQGVKPPPPPQAAEISGPTVTSVIVNGGDPVYRDGNGVAWSLVGQNSVVEQLLVTFSESVTLDEGAFTITNNAAAVTVVSGASPSTLSVTPSSTVVSGSSNKQFVITFSGDGTRAVTGGTGRIIKDGFYLLNTIGSKVHSESTGLAATDNSTAFWALTGSFGNGNRLRADPNGYLGDGHSAVYVSAYDLVTFQTAFTSNSLNSNSYPYNVAADFNLNGLINNVDLNLLRANYNAGFLTEWNF